MTVRYSVQQDPHSGYWFFVIFEEPRLDVYESDPGFESEHEAQDAAVRWIADNLLQPRE